MSLLRKVTELVTQRGSACADDLLPSLPGVDRAKVLKALQNAALSGKVVCGGRRGRKGVAMIRPGTLPAIYSPPRESDPDEPDDPGLWVPNAPRGPQRAYPSVFAYGQGLAVTLRWSGNDSTGRDAA